MTSDGKQLEGLVSFVEETLIPKGFSVQTNSKVFNEDGLQIAEFDIEVRGKVGTTDIAWLIECRDRPSQGAAPGSWIEQLVGRRKRFGFNKVTAVSTTGFAEGVKGFAKTEGIELREVAEISKEYFKDWFLMNELNQINKQAILHGATVFSDKTEKPEKVEELINILKISTGDTPFLISTISGEKVPLKNAFLGAVELAGNLFDDVVPNGASKIIHLHVNYDNDADNFKVETLHSNVRIRSIQFHGELKIIEKKIPILKTTVYRNIGENTPISHLAVFAPQQFHDRKFSLEFHNINESGETHILLRKIK